MSLKSLSVVAAAAMALCAGAAQAQVQGLANGGFELAPNGPGEIADGWQGNQQTPTRTSALAHSGSFSALLAIAPNPTGGGGSGLFQNSVDHGGLLAVDPLNWGTAPTLTFWAAGNASLTGNSNYSLRYLNSAGGILNPVVNNVIFQGNVDNGWTQFTKAGVVIPDNTSAVFLEMTLATGPSGPAVPCGVDNETGAQLTCDWGTANVYIDDVSLTLAFPEDDDPIGVIPEPETYALMLMGLAAVGVAARRRRSV